jgi:hypothetical protein
MWATSVIKKKLPYISKQLPSGRKIDKIVEPVIGKYRFDSPIGLSSGGKVSSELDKKILMDYKTDSFCKDRISWD